MQAAEAAAVAAVAVAEAAAAVDRPDKFSVQRRNESAAHQYYWI